MTITRYLADHIKKDLERKIVLLGGPRQVGKTTLAKDLNPQSYYLNYDIPGDRPIILKTEWPLDSELVILDELHKLKNWKNLLKGVFDENGVRPRLLVTGSSRLDIVKKMGDSLAGRHLYWKLHPFCCKELLPIHSPQVAMERIIKCSGFPEPYLLDDETEYRRWAKSHIDIILRNDLVDLETVTNISAIETLIELLSRRVGQVVSYESLSEDLQVSPTTIKRWVIILENLFIIFRVTPWSRKVNRSLLKAPKYYFYDCARVQGDYGAKFENFVACSLLKEIDYVNDRFGGKLSLHYLRDREKHEIDFAVSSGDSLRIAIEAKSSDTTFAPGFKAFSAPLKSFGAEAVQLVGKTVKTRESSHGTKLCSAAEWLAEVDFQGFV